MTKSNRAIAEWPTEIIDEDEIEDASELKADQDGVIEDQHKRRDHNVHVSKDQHELL